MRLRKLFLLTLFPAVLAGLASVLVYQLHFSADDDDGEVGKSIVSLIFVKLNLNLMFRFLKHTNQQQKLITRRGFHAESHFITSQGGYILQAVRIVNPFVGEEDRSSLKPVLLAHGYLGAGSAFLIAAEGHLREDATYFEEEVHGKDPSAVGNTLGFVLATSGYDVWLLNARGNVYSTNHTYLSPNQNEYWQFSLDELIRYDLPATIDYVRAVTKRPSVAYIGHSLGTTVMYGLLATQPEKYTAQVRPFIALAPVAYFTRMKASSRNLAPWRDTIHWLLPRSFGTGWFQRLGLPRLCARFRWVNDALCYRLIRRTGSTDAQIDRSRVSVYIDNGMLGSSTRTFIQLMQQTRGLRYFNFSDPATNLQVYGREESPPYNFTRIVSPFLVDIHVKVDRYVDLENIRLLKADIRVPFAREYQIDDQSWGHVDLLWGKNVGKVVNSRVLRYLADLA